MCSEKVGMALSCRTQIISTSLSFLRFEANPRVGKGLATVWHFFANCTTIYFVSMTSTVRMTWTPSRRAAFT